VDTTKKYSGRNTGDAIDLYSVLIFADLHSIIAILLLSFQENGKITSLH
jgi:hypothetical protein